jgi:hypothetical protein
MLQNLFKLLYNIGVMMAVMDETCNQSGQKYIVVFVYLRYLFYYYCICSASWSSGQSFWLLIMRSRVRLPVLPLGFFPEGEDPHGDHGLGSLVEFRFKAPPGTSYSYITIHLIGTT